MEWGNITSLFVSVVTGLVGIGVAGGLAWKVLRNPPGSPQMQEISQTIHKGAMTFLQREYSYIAFFIVGLVIVLFLAVSWLTAVAYLMGALCSIGAGYFGMQIATRSNARTAEAARESFNKALLVAFPGGAVMGLSVAGLGLFGLSLVYLIYIWWVPAASLAAKIFQATRLIVGFSLGASSVALFARVGGGIYTKAADVGADLVGKVEKGIPEDDPRNPAVIADNVGDNVGDVAGMGADLYESYVGAIISALVIAASQANTKAIMLALLLASWGLISCLVGIFFVRAPTKRGGREADPQTGLRNGLIASAGLLVVGAFCLSKFWYESINPFWAVLSGLVAGMVVGFVAEYYTSGKAVRRIAEATRTGPATNIIQGMATGMQSTAIPLIVIGIATVIAFHFMGIFGVALSAIGMLSIVGMTVAVDAYGPIADNAAGIAEMAGMGTEVRQRTERLDAVGNTTAAIAKGFAIGSAALTALALFSAYATTVNLSGINVLNAKVVAGLFIGGVVPFIFVALTMQAVGKAAFFVVEEVRRQFREIPGLMEGTAKPESSRCVDITTKGALRQMIIPGLIAVIAPIIVGILLGPEALGGFLAGSIVSGVPLAIFLANAGGAWDNAKKYIEEGNLGGKGSQVHKDSVVGDTVGDPCKDTAGPSLNILLKLMSIISLVFALAIYHLHTVLMNMLF